MEYIFYYEVNVMIFSPTHRYRQLEKMEDERDVILINHLGFLECPSSVRCYYKDLCAETKVQSVLEVAAKTVK